MESIRPSKGRSLPGVTASGRTSQVRRLGECDRTSGTHFLEITSGGTINDRRRKCRARGTHFLETASGGTSQDTEDKVENHKISDTEVVADPVVLVVTLFQ